MRDFSRHLLKRAGALWLVFLVMATVLVCFTPTAQAQTSSSGNPDLPFLLVWERTDYPIAVGAAQRSFYWGPAPFSTGFEPYSQSPGGRRQVLYWDKSRMEINNPNANPTVKGYLTNGLLVKELVTGRVQVADNDYFNRLPAQVPVSGDTAEFNPDAPTYASFRDVVSLDPFSKAPRVNGAVTNFIDKAGNVSQNSSYATRYPETNLVYYDETLGHNISAPMWRFMNASGLVYANKQLVNQVLEDWVFAFGLPISEPYWTRSRVAGEEKDVLVQLFERRVLTYTPSNQAAFQVEMGNVGRHYFTWRYPSGGLTETPASAEPAVRLLIPSIGVDSQIEYVGQTPSGAMDVPVKPENVAWYKLGTPVGSRGSAVITGHLDYYATGKAVFWDLNKLQVGDTYSIVTSTGRRLTFRVTKTEIYEVSQVPLSVIFGPSSTADLNLITCDGAFNASNADYSRRLVVYSTLV